MTSVSAAAAPCSARPLVERDEMLTVLPGTLPPDELADRLRDTDAAAVMKLGRTFAHVREALRRPAGSTRPGTSSGRPPTGSGRRRSPTSTRTSVPYFSLALLPEPGRQRRRRPRPRPRRSVGEVAVVGARTRPAADWTDAARRGGARGGRRPGRLRPLPRPGAGRPAPARHAVATTGSRPSGPRSRSTWPRAGARVAVVSVRRPRRLRDGHRGAGGGRASRSTPTSPVRVLPGLTAAQAVASRGRARRSGTTTASSRCPTGSSRGT